MPSATTPQYDPSVEYQKGLTDLQAGKFRDAQRDFDHVLDSLPHDADTLFYSGMSKAGLGDLKGAQRMYERSLKEDANQIPARRELAVTLAKLGQADQAKAQLDILQTRATACGDTCPPIGRPEGGGGHRAGGHGAGRPASHIQPDRPGRCWLADGGEW